ncbi:major facilitator superfamily domain-containing protein [Tribonema minus]|uniref:Major facilitator superfamily domain-containing protein n=1 Tax=Tribonema minus TaxID=303371 RepID=A0A836CPP9_9STRA|nr:major facilitator superfamily domain-containing protein [Tribonema minus]
MARSLVPGMMVSFFGGWTYHVIGAIETCKGCLAFIACPAFGRLSDSIGRRRCLLITVLGTTLPWCSLAFTSSLWVFVVLQSLSGCFAATFPLAFAYIADLVPAEKRAPAYGLALATFGLSYSVGPVAGAYLSREVGARAVFLSTVILTLVDLAYILLVLPESGGGDAQGGGGGACPSPTFALSRGPSQQLLSRKGTATDADYSYGAAGEGVFAKQRGGRYVSGGSSCGSACEAFQTTIDGRVQLEVDVEGGSAAAAAAAAAAAEAAAAARDRAAQPWSALKAFDGDPVLHRVAAVVFLYYTGVWAVVSTLMVYVVRQKRIGFDAVMVGQLMGTFGLCTMFSEAVLVRVLRWLWTWGVGAFGFCAALSEAAVVPFMGEKRTMQLGLLGFAAQCIMIGFADSRRMIFASMAGGTLSNLFYPSMSSLVSKSVSLEAQGEVLGTINGVRALTEGFGPLVFGALMSYFETSALPGAPYLIASAVGVAALSSGCASGPLVFGAFMSYFEASALPGAPYLIASAVGVAALGCRSLVCGALMSYFKASALPGAPYLVASAVGVAALATRASSLSLSRGGGGAGVRPAASHAAAVFAKHPHPYSASFLRSDVIFTKRFLRSDVVSLQRHNVAAEFQAASQVFSQGIPDAPAPPLGDAPSEPVRKSTSLSMEPLFGLLLDERPEESLADYSF